MNPALYKDPNLGQAPVREVVLNGELGRKFGKIHRLSAWSAAEAVQALCIMERGFKRELGDAADRGVAYALWVDGKNIGKDDLKFHSSGRIYISPVLQGSKKAGTLQTIIGVVLIVVGALGMTVGAAWGGDVWGEPILMAGIAMTAGGIIQMLAPHPEQNEQNKLKSSWFDGPVNVTGQGNPVPVWYGEGIVGSLVVSGGITIDDYGNSYGSDGGTGGGGGDAGRHQWQMAQ